MFSSCLILLTAIFRLYFMSINARACIRVLGSVLFQLSIHIKYFYNITVNGQIANIVLFEWLT